MLANEEHIKVELADELGGLAEQLKERSIQMNQALKAQNSTLGEIEMASAALEINLVMRTQEARRQLRQNRNSYCFSCLLTFLVLAAFIATFALIRFGPGGSRGAFAGEGTIVHRVGGWMAYARQSDDLEPESFRDSERGADDEVAARTGRQGMDRLSEDARDGHVRSAVGVQAEGIKDTSLEGGQTAQVDAAKDPLTGRFEGEAQAEDVEGARLEDEAAELVDAAEAVMDRVEAGGEDDNDHEKKEESTGDDPLPDAVEAQAEGREQATLEEEQTEALDAAEGFLADAVEAQVEDVEQTTLEEEHTKP
eukprot:scaffold427_cov263-Pinguiococcus_pyrenoidosus.AAC.1